MGGPKAVFTAIIWYEAQPTVLAMGMHPPQTLQNRLATNWHDSRCVRLPSAPSDVDVSMVMRAPHEMPVASAFHVPPPPAVDSHVGRAPQ